MTHEWSKLVNYGLRGWGVLVDIGSNLHVHTHKHLSRRYYTPIHIKVMKHCLVGHHG